MKLKHHLKNTIKLGLVAITSSFIMAASPVQAAEYPDRTVSWIVPFPPGGATDLVSRRLAQEFSKEFGETFVVENKPGASGTIAVNYVIRSKPDGHTISFLASPSLISPLMMAKTPFDLETDIEPIGLAYITPPVLVVNPEVLPNVTDIKSLAEAMKGKSLSYTTAGIGSTGHLTMEIIREELDIDGLHIPFQGGSPAVTALLAGEIGAMFSDSVGVLPHIKSGKLVPIAVSSMERLEVLPDTPTVKEQGIENVEAISWVGLFGSKGTPKEVVDKLNAALKRALSDPDVEKYMNNLGAYPLYGTAQDMAEYTKKDIAIWKKVIENNDLKQK